MEELKDDLLGISYEARDYLKTELKLLKLEMIDHVSHYLASILSRVFLLVLVVVSYGFIGIFAGLYLGRFMELWMSFGLVAAFSLLVLFLAYVFNKRLIHGPIQDTFIKVLALKLKLQ